MVGTKFTAPGRSGAAHRRFVPRPVRNLFLSSLVLLVIILIAGAAYTWYIDQRPPKAPKVSANSYQVTSPLPTAVTPAANAKVGVAVETVSSPVAPGGDASITIRSLAGAVCKISVVYKNVVSKDPNLVQKTADEYGTVTWNWTVDKMAPLGTWPVNVTCYRNALSGYVRADLQVVPTSQLPQQ